LMSLGLHAGLELLSGCFGPDKYDRRGDCHETIEFDKRSVFVLVAADVQVHLLDSRDGELLALKENLVRIRRKDLSETLNLVGEGRREKDGLNSLWNETVTELVPASSEKATLSAYPLTLLHWSPRPCWSSMLSASSKTSTWS